MINCALKRFRILNVEGTFTVIKMIQMVKERHIELPSIISGLRDTTDRYKSECRNKDSHI